MQWIQSFLRFFFDLFFGCRHDHMTRPFTLESHSYKICLDCGQEMPYSLESMRLLNTWEVRRLQQHRIETVPDIAPALESALQPEKPYANWKAVA